MKKIVNYIYSHKKILKQLILVRRHLIHIFMYMCRVIPIQNRKIFVINFYGKGYGDNGKAIIQKLKEKEKNLDIVWAVLPEAKKSIPEGIRCVRYHSLAHYYEMATAHVWIDNARLGVDVIKRKGQYYIQTWHGSMPLKQIEKDTEETLVYGDYVADAKYDSQMADLILSGCSFFTEICKRAFWYDGKILECGTPRLDVLFKNEYEKKEIIRKKMEVPDKSRIILYVPTFRENHRMDCYRLDYDSIIKKMHEITNDDWVCMVRLHPNIAKNANAIKYTDTVYNATGYPDLYELLLIADIVITDYSSIMFEAGLIEKPVFLFATDINDYLNERKLYFEISHLPFPLAQNNNELLQKLELFDVDQYREMIKEFNNKINYFEDGTAAETVAQHIVELI